MKLSILADDLASSVDFAPNKQQKEVHAVFLSCSAFETDRVQ